MKAVRLIMSIITVLGLCAQGIPHFFRPTLEVDAAKIEGAVSSRASGYLYGVAQSNVPDRAMTESIDISSASQKVTGGLQHPVGDVDEVAGQLESCDYIVIYLQDCFDTWYYCTQEIEGLRRAGSYDSAEFVRTRFLPQLTEKVSEISVQSYAGRTVYCPYNECDNAVWFGSEGEDGSVAFDSAARQRFYAAWKETYAIIRSIDPNALIGGPGYCDYNSERIEEFLAFCSSAGCLPDVMIYHELGTTSAYYWQDHVDNYRELERRLGTGEIPVIVTEYAHPDECGNPAKMLQYIVKIENSGVYGNVAFWRLANNLCDTAADNNSPNSNWWLYRWYADMEGSLLKSRMVDVLHADVANVVKYNRKRFHYSQFTGLASMTLAQDRIEAICGGCDYTGSILFKNLGSTAFGSGGRVRVKIECVYFEGISGVVNAPVTVSEYTDKITLGKLRVEVKNMDPTAVYHVVVTAGGTEKEDYVNKSLPVRREFEEGMLAGGAYTYHSGYASTGLENGLVGGLENEGDAVTVRFEVPESGRYRLGIIFGNSNDGATPDSRTFTTALMSLDGENEQILLPNTIKSEYTDKYTLERYFEAGEHTLSLAHQSGTFVVDSLLIAPAAEEKIAVLEDSDRSKNGTTSFLAVIPEDGFYAMNIGREAGFTVDGARGYAAAGRARVYLRRGLNYVDVGADECGLPSIEACENGDRTEIAAQSMRLSGSAVLRSGCNGEKYVDGITNLGGSAEFTVTVPSAGSYRMTLRYSNNEEGGVHAYNVDLIERYVTVTAGGKSQNVWCRNTYSWDTFKTVTANLELEEGENVITLTNNGKTVFNGRTAFAPLVAGVSVNRTAE